MKKSVFAVAVLALTAGAAMALYARLRERPDVGQILAQGTCYYEVPFSYVPADSPDTVVRGAID